MAIVTLPNIGGGSDPATINVSVLNGKVDPLATDYNGNIQDVNIAAGAGIVYSKLNLTDSVVNADINSAAAIVASKLNLSTIAQALVMTSKIINQAKGADVASAAGNIVLGDDGNYFDITGTAAITSITIKQAGTVVTLQTDSTASLVDGGNLKLAGTFQGAAESTITLVSDGTNWFETARQPSTFIPTVANALAGSVVQVVNVQTGSVASGTTAMVNDDSIPQNTEGDEYMTLAITPNNSSNKLKIEVTFVGAHNGNQDAGMVALFQDTTADALAAAAAMWRAGSLQTTTFTHYMAAGTISATTFKVRAGGASGTLTFNGIVGLRIMGGVLASSITITEIKV